MKKQYQVTQAGLDELKEELARLIASRGDIAQKIATAREFGDLTENAEYDAAREEQGLMETRIMEIEDIIKNAKIISANGTTTVQVGSTVAIVDEGGTKLEYMIVGPVEADPLEGKISDESPIGAAVLGKKKGESFTVETPRGKKTYKIESIK